MHKNYDTVSLTDAMNNNCSDANINNGIMNLTTVYIFIYTYV